MAKRPPARPAAAPATIDDVIARCPPAVAARMARIRRIVRAEAPAAIEVISYRMPAFRRRGILLFFSPFRAHIGLYPPVTGDAALERAIAPFAGPKGNLKFPHDQPLPLALIRRIVRLRVAQDDARAPAAAGTRRRGIARSRRAERRQEVGTVVR